MAYQRFDAKIETEVPKVIYLFCTFQASEAPEVLCFLKIWDQDRPQNTKSIMFSYIPRPLVANALMFPLYIGVLYIEPYA